MYFLNFLSSGNAIMNYYQGVRGEMIMFLPEKYSKVLEIGCAEGDFRQHFSSNCEYWGIEPVQSVADVARDKLDKLLIGSYQDVKDQLPSNYFDLVICNDVIEHMADHDAFFNSIKTVIIKRGYIVGSVPNVRYYWNLYDLLIKKDWEYTDSGILDKTHLRFFSEKSLKRAFRQNGLVIEKFHGINGISKIGALMRLVIFLLGQDLRFVQFGFRVNV